MNTILDVEAPDLAILNGDLITGENTYLHNSTDYLDIVVEPLVARDVPWASTYGNHDINFNLSTRALLEREQAYRTLSYTQSMVNTPGAGVSNYYIPIFSSDVNSYTPEVILWFFDSQGGVAFQELDSDGNQIHIPGVVDPSVVDWFTATNKFLAKAYGATIPSLAFVHIPTFASAAAQLTGSGINKRTAPGINDDSPAAAQGINSKGEYDGSDIPFMKALLDTDGLLAIFSGHDHGDDWYVAISIRFLLADNYQRCYKWDSELNMMSLTGNGLSLCFGRHSGYGGYGQWTRGSRQIRLTRSALARREVETWIRLEDETVSGWVTLNRTYGVDQYPAVKDAYT